MNLSNSQYETIKREYDAIQLKNQNILQKRREEVYAACPAYEEASLAVSSLSINYGRRILAEETGARESFHKELRALSKKKSDLLIQSGFPADYLEPIFDCSSCHDTGYINGKRCHCLEQRIIEILYSQSNLQKILQTENFSTLSYDYYKESTDLANFKSAVETSFSFIKEFENNYQNLLFFGNVGTGKTFLSNCIARELIRLGHSVLYFSADNFFNQLSRYSFDINNKEMLYKTYEDLYNCDLVIIDDLGTELSNPFTNSKFFSFLNERYLRRKAIIISTNLDLEGLKNRYSERVVSRLASSFIFRKITGPDIRLCKNI